MKLSLDKNRGVLILNGVPTQYKAREILLASDVATKIIIEVGEERNWKIEKVESYLDRGRTIEF